MLNKLQSIPQIFKGLLIGFLVILMIRITYPISNYILGLFEAGTMKIVAILAYWMIIVFVTTFLIWIIMFQKNEGGTTQNG